MHGVLINRGPSPPDFQNFKVRRLLVHGITSAQPSINTFFNVPWINMKLLQASKDARTGDVISNSCRNHRGKEFVLVILHVTSIRKRMNCLKNVSVTTMEKYIRYRVSRLRYPSSKNELLFEKYLRAKLLYTTFVPLLVYLQSTAGQVR